MANPNSYGDLHQPGSHFMHTMRQRSPLHQMPQGPVNQHSNSNEIPLPTGPPPRSCQTRFPPPFSTSSSYPPPPHGVQTLYPPLAIPPNVGYTTPFPFPYPPNNVLPPQAPPFRVPPPSFNAIRLRQRHFSQPSTENVQSIISPLSNAELNLTSSTLKTGEESKDCDDKIQRDGQKKIMAWLHKIGKGKPGQKVCQKKEKSKLTINSYMCNLQKMTSLISKMSSQIEMLESTMSTADKTSWMKDCSEFDKAKEQFGALEKFIGTQLVSQAGIQFARIRQKRSRIQRGKRASREEQLKVLELRLTREKRIDEWQKQIVAEMKEEKLKKERKINMDQTLAEVTKKIQDANRLIETMSAVEKLRLIRRDAAEKRGDCDLGESRHNVAQKIEDMKRLVEGQLDVYKEEEKVLRQAIRLEYEESSKKERQLQQERDEAEKKEKEKNLYTALFGYCGQADMADPLFPYQEFYKQAQKSLPVLLQIRQEWDRHLSSSDAGSAIPSSWIFPCPPTSDVWATALIQE